jgi:hypothetical protein
MDVAMRVYWSVEQCGWVDCPPATAAVEVPQQRAEEPEPAVLTES